MVKHKIKSLIKTPGKAALFLWLFFASSYLFLFLLIVSVQFNLLNFFGEIPSFDLLENPRSNLASELYSSDRQLLGKYFRENRTTVNFEEISPNVLKALYATEDVRFFKHSGIDLKGLLAIIPYLLKGDLRGSSTLSQQTAKNLFKTRSDEYEGLFSNIPVLNKIIIKIKEWITAIRIERSYTKNEILMMYLNTVEFGSNAFGLKTGALTFFNKASEELTIEEAALLVGILKAPTLYSPVLNPDKSLRRRNVVLHQMYKYKYLDKKTYDSLVKIPILLDYNVENQNTGLAPYFREEVKKELQRWCASHGYDLFNSGLKIYTTINSKIQQYAEEAVSEHMATYQKIFYTHWKGRKPWIDENYREIKNFVEVALKKTPRYKQLLNQFGTNKDSIKFYLNKKIKMRIFSWNGERDTFFSPRDSLIYYKYFLRTGFMAMDPEMGHIKAWVGGINHKYFKYDHVKQGKRQPGSLFKPFVYTAAIDNGYSPCFKVPDVPVTVELADGKRWIPRNSDGKYTGEMLTLRQGLARSINSVTAWVIKQFGPNMVINYARRMGVEGFLDPTPSLCLGTSDVSVYEIVSAYGTFVNHGVWTQPLLITRIEDKNGNILQEFIPKTVEAFGEETAYTMLYMMKGATEEKNGTAIALRGRYKFRGEIAAKTGTTQNYSDAWFVGITPHLVADCWVGGEDKFIHFRSMAYGQGARLAMPMWALFMKKILADTTLGIKEEDTFTKPLKPLPSEFNCHRKNDGADSVLNDKKKYYPSQYNYSEERE
ncbi:MAG: hypothetical protein A3H98_00010 [Bacteroidetes bacterium RIFCSPLOWO2_02_FULL_36_8]|nr:MAG: hypothetical protein A3H98_00010 [Bacteroidetes bacterium RIFCSPLOWO2_02_FULL_36_8]